MTKIIDITKRVYSGGTPDTRKSEYWNGDIKWLSSGETRNNFIFDTDKKITELGVNNSSTKLASKGSIVMACAGQGFTRGQTSYLMDDMYINQSVICIEPDDNKVDGLYLYYFFKNNYQLLRSLSNDHSSRGSITTAMIKDFEVNFPDIDIQKRISNILYSIDQKIELNNKINNNLYKLIKNNYESLINGCNWEEVELGAISNITSGKRPFDKSEIGEYPVIGANGIMAYTSDYNFSEDLIITGRVGTLGVVKRYLGKIWASDNTLVIQTKYLNYIENYLKTIDYYSLNRGSTQPLLTQGDLKKQIIYFNDELVTKFEKDNQIFVDKIRNNEKENSKLIQLRDTLLPKLMNSEINLDNIEI
jgi:type I restriction enzyme S subunit